MDRLMKELIFNKAWDKYRKVIFLRCWSYTLDRHEAEDVCQDVFLSAWAGLDSFKGNSSISTWLYTINTHVVSNHRIAKWAQKRGSRYITRSIQDFNKKYSAMEGGIEKIVDRIQDINASGFDKTLATYQLTDMFLQRVSRLPEKQRDVMLAMLDNPDDNYNTIAKKMGLARNTFYHRLDSSRRMVQKFSVVKDIIG